MLYARTPQQGNGRVERATAQSTNKQACRPTRKRIKDYLCLQYTF